MDDLLSVVEYPDPEITPLGVEGERLAVRYLTDQGFRIVMTNFRVPIGRNTKGVAVTGEIDIVALDGETLCFVEVKTRRSDDFAPIITAVDNRKQRQIIRTAKVYRRVFDLYQMKYRYDVVTVLMPESAPAKIELIRGMWSEAKFRKKRWTESGYDGF